ncbi:MAG: DUF4476 domain-containing protein [Chitinophagales bacterium]
MKAISTSASAIKKIMALAVLLLSLQFTYAAAGNILNVRLMDGAPFRVIIDGREAGGVGTIAKLGNLCEGQHFMQVYRIDNSWGYETMDNAYRGYITLTPNTESFITVYSDMQKIMFDRIVSLSAVGKPAICQGPTYQPGGAEVVECATGNQNHCQPFVPAGPLPMNGAAFSQLKQTICNGTFESTKLSIFKQALGYNYFSSQQVLELMNLFTFESYRLEVAKLAYPKTLDQNNYYLVNNGFTFSSSVDNLNDYLAMR